MLLKIRVACDRLEQGRLNEALKAANRISDPEQTFIAESIALTARGLLFEQRQEIAEADECFAEVFSRGVPLPTILREVGRYYKRRAQYDRAFQCFALLRGFEDPNWMTRGGQFAAALNPRIPRDTKNRARDAVTELVDGLPPIELARHSPWIVGELIGARGLNPWVLPRFKEALASQLGPRGAAFTFAAMARKKPGWEVVNFRLTSLRDYARSHALTYEELAASRTIEMPPQRVFGAPRSPSMEIETRTWFFAILEDVVVPAMSNLLIAGDQALLDYQDDELPPVRQQQWNRTDAGADVEKPRARRKRFQVGYGPRIIPRVRVMAGEEPKGAPGNRDQLIEEIGAPAFGQRAIDFALA